MCSAILTAVSTTLFFFFTDTATPEIYPLSLHDALPISDVPVLGHRLQHLAAPVPGVLRVGHGVVAGRRFHDPGQERGDRKSTRLNSSHITISYAVFCLKKKKKT